MITDANKTTQKRARKKEPRQSLTLYLSAKQGDLLKEVLYRELEDAKSKGREVRSKEISKILTLVQDALNRAERYARMRNQSKKENL